MTGTAANVNGNNSLTPTKKKRPGDGIEIFSQPALTGTGAELGTQMVYAVNHLKERDRDLSITDIVDHLTRHPQSPAEWAELVEHMRRHPRVHWTPDPTLTEQTIYSGTYRHNPVIPGVRSKESLLAYLQSRKDAMLVHVKDLEDGWPKESLYPAITELERQHKIHVVRTKKDNHPRYVWQDDATLWKPVDPEFMIMWNKVNVPTVDDMNRLLLQAGQKPASEDPRLKELNAKVEKVKKKPKKKAPRNVTNTHLKGALSMFKDL
ncbi:hypothetical protein BD289DRAFT_359080 [Coniella lustricola]|uniref:Transcription initiation factor IIE subunit beta n=1 Tax=Coniella lustricola TaxID=2025994 RepID=A0A2T3AMB0_9PEZI|nr:hypothetical protein BD289DRAFT_359080 [Coniella lustricola]